MAPWFMRGNGGSDTAAIKLVPGAVGAWGLTASDQSGMAGAFSTGLGDAVEAACMRALVSDPGAATNIVGV